MPEIFTPKMRVYRKLDTQKLSPEFIEHLSLHEDGTVEYVDADRARDQVWTEEIMEFTVGAALVDEEGNIVKTFDGPNGFVAAEKARSSVRVIFDYEVDDENPVIDGAVPAGFQALEQASSD